ncbi:MAG TPA: DUF3147 family protein [Burkholderiaceae bacterium]|nr:DUF3147 family protein [Burkholderiaceae bacterium]
MLVLLGDGRPAVKEVGALLVYLIKVAVTAIVVVLVAELAKRSTLAGAVLASIPLTSVLAMIWLYADTADVGKVGALASSIFWLVLPSLVLFIALPWLLKQGMGFYWSLALSVGATSLSYGLMLWMLRRCAG